MPPRKTQQASIVDAAIATPRAALVALLGYAVVVGLKHRLLAYSGTSRPLHARWP